MFISHNDADGIVSALLYQQYNPENKFNGFYDLESLYLQKDLEENDLAIDLDMINMKSVGHHINPIVNERACNPNKNLKDLYGDYKHKCPLNAAMLMVIKYNITLTNIRQYAILIFADGFYNYYKKYTDNCKNWLNNYGLRNIELAMDRNEEEIMKIINEEIIPIFAPEKYKKLEAVIKDSRLQNADIVKEFSQYVIDAFGLDLSSDMFDMVYYTHYKYIVKTIPIYSKQQYDLIVSRLNDVKDKLVSAALVYRDKLRVTMKEDILIY